MLGISPEFSRPVEHLIKNLSRNASAVRKSFFIWQVELFETNLYYYYYYYYYYMKIATTVLYTYLLTFIGSCK